MHLYFLQPPLCLHFHLVTPAELQMEHLLPVEKGAQPRHTGAG